MSARVYFVFGLVLALVVGGPRFDAVRLRGADIRSGGRVVIGADQVVNDDMYIAAEEIVIDGTVNGDVYALANTITVNGTIQHDLNAAGQTVLINGTVGDSTRLAAQTIVFGDNSNVERSALLAGFSIETKPTSTIGGDVLFGAYQALLAGNIGKDVLAGANGIELRGNVGRNVRVGVGDNENRDFQPTMFMSTNAAVPIPEVPAGLTIATSAKIGGDLTYESQKPAVVQSGSQVTGPVVRQTPVPNLQERTEPVSPAVVQAQQTQGFIEGLLDQGRRFVILLLLGLLALWLLPQWIQSLAGFIRTKPLGSLGRGVLMFLGFIGVLIGLVFVVILLAVFFGVITFGTLAGMVIVVGTVLFGALAVGYWLFTSFIAPIVVSFLIGRAIFDRVQAPWAQNRVIAFVVGLILLSLVALIPILNGIVGVLVVLFALGALLLWLSQRLSRSGPAAMQPA